GAVCPRDRAAQLTAAAFFCATFPKHTVIALRGVKIAHMYAVQALPRLRIWRDAMNAQDTRKRSIDWLMRLAQVASITVALIISTEFIARHWRAIVSAFGLG